MTSKTDMRIEHFDDCTKVFLLSEDAVAWVEENFAPEAHIGGYITLPRDGAETLEEMRKDGLTE